MLALLLPPTHGAGTKDYRRPLAAAVAERRARCWAAVLETQGDFLLGER